MNKKQREEIEAVSIDPLLIEKIYGVHIDTGIASSNKIWFGNLYIFKKGIRLRSFAISSKEDLLVSIRLLRRFYSHRNSK
jgi:hypothetical protein